MPVSGDIIAGGALGGKGRARLGGAFRTFPILGVRWAWWGRMGADGPSVKRAGFRDCSIVTEFSYRL